MNIIEKLQNISIDDIKNIDFEELKEQILSRPEILIAILCILISVGSIIYGFSFYSNNKSKYTKDIRQLKEKQKMIETLDKSKKDYNKFIKNFSENISKDILGSKISEFAINNNIRITSFSPGKSHDFGFSKIQDFSLSVTVPGNRYDDLILFIKDIENSPYAIRIEEWSGNIKNAKKRIETNSQETIRTTMRIQSLYLNK